MSKLVKMSATQIESYGVIMSAEIKGSYFGNVVCCLSDLISKIAEAIETPKEMLLEVIVNADRLINASKEKAAQAAGTAERQKKNISPTI